MEKGLDKAFVDGWVISQILGEGAFGEVRLMAHPETGYEVAMKVVNLAKDTSGLTKREVLILKMLKHENIVSFIGQRIDSGFHYIFLEYAAGGELFDRIEPDVGIPEAQAQHYFRQLIGGVEYLHGVGVAHRDLKPENLLLTEDDVLKITDFGLATIFRHKGVERKLSKRCGTLVYVAPEVFQGEYDAAPADIWSCGVVLVALLTGELPWDSPMPECVAFMDWKERRSLREPPWSKMHNVAISLLRCVLHWQPDQRATIDRIKAHQWFTKDFSKKATTVQSSTPVAKRLCFVADRNEIMHSSDLEPRFAFSQTDGSSTSATLQGTLSNGTGLTRTNTSKDARLPLSTADPNSGGKGVFSFSQPAVLENLILGSQSQHGEPSQQNMLQKLVRRMTRFVIDKPIAAALAEITSVCKDSKILVKQSTEVQLTISLLDRRLLPLEFKATAYAMGGKTLLDFRLSKGDGLEFKRTFVKIRDRFRNVIDNDMLNAWANPASMTA